MTWHLEPLDPDDAARVVRWAPTREDVTLFGGQALPHPLTGAALLATAEQGWQVLALCDETGDVAGTGSVRRVDEHTARVGRVLLDPSRRGQGLGRVLMERLLAHATADPWVTGVTLAVFDHNLPALRLYQSLGFRDTGERRTTEIGNRSWPGGEYRLDVTR